MGDPIFCKKCDGTWNLLPVDRVVDLGCTPSETLAQRVQGIVFTYADYERMTKKKGIIRIWKCNNCGFEVK